MIDQPDFHKYAEFFDAIYHYNWILDGRGRIIKANLAALELAGLTEVDVTGTPIWDVPWDSLSRRNRQILRRAVNQATKGELVQYELEIQRYGQPEIILDFTLKPIVGENGTVTTIIAEGLDITAHKRTSEALFQSEARFKTIFEKAGIGIVIKGISGKMLDWNPTFLNMLGYTAEELSPLDYLDITHPMDKGISRKLFNELVNGKRKSYITEKRYLHKDGQAVWARITASLVHGTDGQPQFVIGMVDDINLQKQIEAEIQELRRRLMQSRESERLRVALDLHDGPLQDIIALSYQVKDLESNITNDADREQIKTIRNDLLELTKSIRTICGELRPPTLAPFGLEKTILSHAEGFQATHPELQLDLKLAHDDQLLSEQTRLALFRIYQEALNNIFRHAQAKTVWVRLKLKDEQAILEIKDDGVGFKLPDRWISLARKGHLGLVGAMERSKDVGGNLEIFSTPGKGTIIRAIVPIKEELIQLTGEEEKS